MSIKHNKFEILSQDRKLADVELNPNGIVGSIKVQQYVEGFIRQFQKRDEDITTKDFNNWLVWRTFPSSRDNREDILKALGLKEYSRYDIVKKTHGVMADDDIWLRFSGEELTYKDVSLRDL